MGAQITIPGVSGDIDQTSRTTTFRHERSHAVYFTDPAYVALIRNFWNGLLTELERNAIRAFLGADGYDTTDKDLMANEAQAYLIHMHDPRYFMPAMAGIDPARESMLRATFTNSISEPWLRQSALAVAPISPASTPPLAAPQAVSVEPSMSLAN